jgi:hypothetical protein
MIEVGQTFLQRTGVNALGIMPTLQPSIELRNRMPS